MSNDNDSSRNRAEEAGKPMEPKTENTKAVEAGKAENPMGQKAKAHGHEEHEGEKNPNLPND
ncbi:hypothetical protein BH11ARM2_BH11ARM2_07600 [soil metagenome]